MRDDDREMLGPMTETLVWGCLSTLAGLFTSQLHEKVYRHELAMSRRVVRLYAVYAGCKAFEVVAAPAVDAGPLQELPENRNKILIK